MFYQSVWVITVAAGLIVPVVQAQAAAYGQCGGTGWTVRPNIHPFFVDVDSPNGLNS